MFAQTSNFKPKQKKYPGTLLNGGINTGIREHKNWKCTWHWYHISGNLGTHWEEGKNGYLQVY